MDKDDGGSVGAVRRGFDLKIRLKFCDEKRESGRCGVPAPVSPAPPGPSLDAVVLVGARVGERGIGMGAEDDP